MLRAHSLRWLSLMPLILCCTSGCGDELKLTVYSVEGQLLVGGVPAANASLAFHPVTPNALKVCPVAMTGPDGFYRLTTLAMGDGAPRGEYVVTVVWTDDLFPVDECECRDATVHDRLRGRYADRDNSTLRATVSSERNVITFQVDDSPDLRRH